MFRSTVALIFVSFAFACAETEQLSQDAGTAVFDDAGLPDASDPPDTGFVEPRFVFESSDPEDPSLVFANAMIESNRLIVDVQGRGLANVHGLAFRLKYDPAMLTMTRFENIGLFPSSGLERTAEVRPGLVVVALGNMGAAGGVAVDGASIARLTFDRLVEAPTSVALERGFALDAAGYEIKIRAGTGNIVER